MPPAALSPEGSTFLTGLFAYALDLAAQLHHACGYQEDGDRWVELAVQTRTSIRQHAWSEESGLFLDEPDRKAYPFFQHAQVMAVLSGAASPNQCRRLADRLVCDSSFVPMSLSQRFLLARALEQLNRYEGFSPIPLAAIAMLGRVGWFTTSSPPFSVFVRPTPVGPPSRSRRSSPRPPPPKAA